MNFTYENFAKDGVFTLLDPLFTLIVIFSALFCIIVFRFSVNAKIMLFIAAFTILLGAQLLSIEGIITDELNLSASSKNMYQLLIAALLQIGAAVYAFIKEKKRV